MASLFCCDQVQHIVTETRDKIMQYKSKMADEADLRRRLANLEESVELHEHMKRQVTHSPLRGQFCFLELIVTYCFQFGLFSCSGMPVLFVTSAFMVSGWRWWCFVAQLTQLFCHHQALAEFEMYRQRMEDSQLCTEAQHTQRVVSMSREVRPYVQHTHMHWLGKGLQQPCKSHWLCIECTWMNF